MNMTTSFREQQENKSMMHENPRHSPVQKEVVNNLARDLECIRRENEIMQRHLEELREKDRR